MEQNKFILIGRALLEPIFVSLVTSVKKGKMDLTAAGKANIPLHYRLSSIYFVGKIAERNLRDFRPETEIVHKAFQPCLYTAQVFFIMPLYGISGDNTRKLGFKWKSLRFFLALTAVLIDLFFLLFILFRYGINQRSTGWLIFYTVTSSIMVSFLILSYHWKNLVMKWSMVYDLLEMDSEKTIKILKWFTIIALTLAIGEHLLSQVNAIFTQRRVEGDNAFQIFLKKKYRWAYRFFGYSDTFAMTLLLVHFQMTVAWNFCDIFLFNVTYALSLMFEHFCDDMKAAVKKNLPKSYWRHKRETYRRLGDLVKEVDRRLSNITLVSFGSNLFFICFQLYHSFSLQESFMKSIYFYGSLLFLILRTSCVCYGASKLYENSKKPMSIIYTIPSEYFNSEIDRLFDTIKSDTLAITGYHFFTVNRKLVVGVIGTITTYEIVLVQFGSFKED